MLHWALWETLCTPVRWASGETSKACPMAVSFCFFQLVMTHHHRCNHEPTKATQQMKQPIPGVSSVSDTEQAFCKAPESRSGCKLEGLRDSSISPAIVVPLDLS